MRGNSHLAEVAAGTAPRLFSPGDPAKPVDGRWLEKLNFEPDHVLGSAEIMLSINPKMFILPDWCR